VGWGGQRSGGSRGEQEVSGQGDQGDGGGGRGSADFSFGRTNFQWSLLKRDARLETPSPGGAWCFQYFFILNKKSLTIEHFSNNLVIINITLKLQYFGCFKAGNNQDDDEVKLVSQWKAKTISKIVIDPYETPAPDADPRAVPEEEEELGDELTGAAGEEDGTGEGASETGSPRPELTHVPDDADEGIYQNIQFLDRLGVHKFCID